MSQPAVPAPAPQKGPALKIESKADQRKKLTATRNILILAGSVLLACLSAVPIWNALILLQDSNYIFWANNRIPRTIIIGCFCIIIFYAVTVMLFFTKPHAATQIENTVMIIGNITITLFGLFLMFASVPLTHQVELTTLNLLHRCETSEQTHRLYEYSQVLQNIRATPECAGKYSIEECHGYEDAPPFTTMLKGMEMNFRCAGFCYSPPSVASESAPAAPDGIAATALISTKRNLRHQLLDTDAVQNEESVQETLDRMNLPTYPPTLFSDENFQASCDAQAARDMKFFAGDIGKQMFWQGIYFVLISVFTGFMGLAGMCVSKA